MEVLRHGIKYSSPKPKEFYKLTCDNCGCEFKCSEDEVEEDYTRDCGGYEYTGKFYAECPECGKEILAYDRYADKEPQIQIL